MDRKTYMRDVFPNYWITAREKTYGFPAYDRNLCNYLLEHVNAGGKLLDVAMGTGYPFGDFFQKAGYSVHGVDIAPALVERCRQLYPNIDCKIGDAEELDYPDNCFDCTYCFHSTWVIPNLDKAIGEMLRVTRPGGLVMFDLQNRNNKEIDTAYRRNLSRHTRLGTIIRYSKNVAKIILRRGTPVWRSIVYETPIYPEAIYEFLRARQISNFQVMVTNEDASLQPRSELDSFADFARLVFVIGN